MGLTSCRVDRPESNGKVADVVLSGSKTYYSVCVVDYTMGGMHYKVFNSAHGDVFVVNVTKDSLECIKDTIKKCQRFQKN